MGKKSKKRLNRNNKKKPVFDEMEGGAFKETYKITPTQANQMKITADFKIDNIEGEVDKKKNESGSIKYEKVDFPSDRPLYLHMIGGPNTNTDENPFGKYAKIGDYDTVIKNLKKVEVDLFIHVKDKSPIAPGTVDFQIIKKQFEKMKKESEAKMKEIQEQTKESKKKSDMVEIYNGYSQEEIDYNYGSGKIICDIFHSDVLDKDLLVVIYSINESIPVYSRIEKDDVINEVLIKKININKESMELKVIKKDKSYILDMFTQEPTAAEPTAEDPTIREYKSFILEFENAKNSFQLPKIIIEIIKNRLNRNYAYADKIIKEYEFFYTHIIYKIDDYKNASYTLEVFLTEIFENDYLHKLTVTNKELEVINTIKPNDNISSIPITIYLRNLLPNSVKNYLIKKMLSNE